MSPESEAHLCRHCRYDVRTQVSRAAAAGHRSYTCPECGNSCEVTCVKDQPLACERSTGAGVLLSVGRACLLPKSRAKIVLAWQGVPLTTDGRGWAILMALAVWYGVGAIVVWMLLALGEITLRGDWLWGWERLAPWSSVTWHDMVQHICRRTSTIAVCIWASTCALTVLVVAIALRYLVLRRADVGGRVWIHTARRAMLLSVPLFQSTAVFAAATLTVFSVQSTLGSADWCDLQLFILPAAAIWTVARVLRMGSWDPLTDAWGTIEYLTAFACGTTFGLVWFGTLSWLTLGSPYAAMQP